MTDDEKTPPKSTNEALRPIQKRYSYISDSPFPGLVVAAHLQTFLFSLTFNFVLHSLP